jgi:hypothetical protein
MPFVMAEIWVQGEKVYKLVINLTSRKVAELLCYGMQAVAVVGKHTNTTSTCQCILGENAGQGLLVCKSLQKQTFLPGVQRWSNGRDKSNNPTPRPELVWGN